MITKANNEPNYLLSNTRGKLKRLYGTSYETFAKWVKRNPTLNKLLNEDYKDIRTLPPEVVQQVIIILGEPG